MTITATFQFLLKDIRNELDFWIRSRARWSRPVLDLGKRRAFYSQLQSEIGEFLQGVPTQEGTPGETGATPLALDVGAKDFFAGPAIEHFLLSRNQPCELHGIEIDAYRRLQDFRTRADYGMYFAAHMKRGQYHAMDFFRWTEPARYIFLLNPFVFEAPLQAWGLPSRLFQPENVFSHCHDILERSGRLVLSVPNQEELRRSKELATQTGFTLLHEWHWHPRTDSIQKQSRIGTLWIKAEA